jgi:hypothetical protein
MARGHRETIGKSAGGTVQQAADGQIEERPAGAPGVAQSKKVFFNRHGFRF